MMMTSQLGGPSPWRSAVAMATSGWYTEVWKCFQAEKARLQAAAAAALWGHNYLSACLSVRLSVVLQSHDDSRKNTSITSDSLTS